MVNKSGILYLIPTGIGDELPENYLTPSVMEIIRKLKCFVVENEKSARAFLKLCQIESSQKDLLIHEIDKHNHSENYDDVISWLREENNVGLLSEAGCPAVADPGSRIVALAHKKKFPVKPLTGPSSLLLALMGSGLDGQRFRFNGYLPAEKQERREMIRKLDKEAKQRNETQIFIETPYRNNAMLSDLLEFCNPETRLCLAVSLHTSTESIRPLSISKWKSEKPDLNKKPCVFLIL